MSEQTTTDKKSLGRRLGCFVGRTLLCLITVLAALVITAVFAGSVWCLSMNSYEKELIRKPLRRLFVKK